MDLKQLAQELGLSMTTVSRALNGYPEVAARTRDRVIAAAREHGYRPNANARRLATGKTESVGLILPLGFDRFADPFYLDLVAGIGERLQRAGIDLLVTAAASETDEMRAYQRFVDGGRVDCLVLPLTRSNDPRIAYLQDRGAPFVVYGRTEAAKPYAYLDIDNEAAFDAATTRLLDKGHRRIALINERTDFNFARHRDAGYRAALARAGVPVDPALVAVAAMTDDTADHATRALMAMADPPTALLVGGGRATVGVLRALQDLGLAAGRDVALIGFADDPRGFVGVTPAGLTVTHMVQPTRRCAERLADMALAIMDGADESGLQELWLPDFVVGDTDCPPPQKAAQSGNDPRTARRRKNG